jgi:hypothetical protein
MSGGAKPDISFGRYDNWWEDATFMSEYPLYCRKERQRRMQMATVTPTAPPGTTWTEDTITELVAELLADLLEEDRDQLAHDLQSAAA